MDPVALIVVVVLFAAALLASIFGFGIGLLAIPILALIVDIKTATPLSAMTAFTVIAIILAGQWRDVQLKVVWRLILGSYLGIPVGILVLQATPDRPMKVALAILIMLFAIYSLVSPAGMHLKTERWSLPFGFLAGILGGAYALPGPPVIIYGIFRKWPPAVFRISLLGFFLPNNIAVNFTHFYSGLWTESVLILYGLSLPGVLLAIFIGNRVNRTLPKGKYDRAIHMLLVILGALLGFAALRA